MRNLHNSYWWIVDTTYVHLFKRRAISRRHVVRKHSPKAMNGWTRFTIPKREKTISGWFIEPRSSYKKSTVICFTGMPPWQFTFRDQNRSSNSPSENGMKLIISLSLSLPPSLPSSVCLSSLFLCLLFSHRRPGFSVAFHNFLRLFSRHKRGCLSLNIPRDSTRPYDLWNKIELNFALLVMNYVIQRLITRLRMKKKK